MKSYKNIVAAYQVKDKAHDEQRSKIRTTIERRQKQIERLQKKGKKLGYVYWIDEIVKPLAEELRKKLGKKYTDILGPFGINCQTSIFFYDTQKQRDACKVKSITFQPGDLSEGILYVETNKSKERYSKGTIGEINGGNIVCERIPKNASLNWFLKYIY